MKTYGCKLADGLTQSVRNDKKTRIPWKNCLRNIEYASIGEKIHFLLK